MCRATTSSAARACSLFLALWLQASPVIRWVIGELNGGNLPAIVIRIGGISAALLGGAEAMSGATTWVSSTNPPSGTRAADLRLAVGAVGEIVGKTSTEDLLDSIFSQFCIGE